MNAIVFDTHEAANRFKAAGFTEEQVEALVDVTRRTTALPDVSTLATKTDLAEVKSELRTAIASAQVQTITVILTAVAAMLVVSRLVPSGVH
jgi:hypothetical protein